MNPPGNYIFSNSDEGKPVTMTYTVQSDDRLLAAARPRSTTSPTPTTSPTRIRTRSTVERVDLYSLPSIQRVEVTSRSNAYSMTPVEARDQGQIEMFGPRVGSTVSAHEICDEFTIGPKVAQLILQRALYVRAKYHFKLSLGILPARADGRGDDHRPGARPVSQAKVRITDIEEDDNGLLTVTAEELVSGIGTATVNPSSGSLGQQHSFDQSGDRRQRAAALPAADLADRRHGADLGRGFAAADRHQRAMGRLQRLGLARRHDLSAGGDHHRADRPGRSHRRAADRRRRRSTTSTRWRSTCR